MYSRVFQIENDWRNLEQQNSVAVDDLPNADCIYDSETPGDDIEWLTKILAVIPTLKVGKNEHGTFIVLGSQKHEWFKKKYENFITAARRCTIVPFEEFASDTWIKSISDLHSAYSDEYGFFVHSYDIGVVTLDHFIRMASPRRRYYIGAIGSYHW